VGRVGVAVDVHLEGGVHGDIADPAGDLGVVADLLGPQDDLFAVGHDVSVEPLEPFRRGGQRRAGDGVELAGVDEIEHGVLDDLRPDPQVLVVALHEARHDGVGHVAHP